jgi:hypothetical protein
MVLMGGDVKDGGGQKYQGIKTHPKRERRRAWMRYPEKRQSTAALHDALRGSKATRRLRGLKGLKFEYRLALLAASLRRQLQDRQQDAVELLFGHREGAFSPEDEG